MFKNRAEQLDYVMRKFVGWLSDNLAQLGKPLPMNIDQIPTIALLGKAVEISKKYTEGLKKRDLGTVYLIIVNSMAEGTPAGDIIEDSARFIEWLDGNESAKQKFFTYTDAILQLLE